MDIVISQFEHPPIDEVVFSAQFEPLGRFSVPYYGLLWDHFRAEYPACQDVAPLLGPIERPASPAQSGLPIDTNLILPRVWFLQPDGPGLIQVQRDRFLVNWRRRRAEDKYPGFEAISRRFRQYLSEFEAFLNDHGIGQLAMVQYELTYVNVIAMGEGWASPTEISRVLPHLSWPVTRHDGVLGDPEALAWHVAFPLSENNGRLHISLQHGRRRTDDLPVLRLELTARGIGRDTSRDAMWDWFDLAHRAIDEGFRDLTSEEVQRDVWGRHH